LLFAMVGKEYINGYSINQSVDDIN